MPRVVARVGRLAGEGEQDESAHLPLHSAWQLDAAVEPALAESRFILRGNVLRDAVFVEQS